MTDILSEVVPSYEILEVAPQVVSGGGGAWGSITGTLADQTDLSAALGGKAATVHVHATSDVTGLDTALSGKAATVHSHAQSDVTGLTTALGLLAPKDAPTFTTSATFSFLTNGRVPYATTGGSLIDNSGFTFDGTSLGLPSGANLTFANSRAIIVTSANPGYIATTGYFGLASSNPNVSDVFLYREAAANLRLGAAASATPVAQTLSVQDGSGTNIAGQNWTLRASRATGNAAGGKILFQTSDVGSSGATLQTATTKFEVGVAGVGFNGTAAIAKPTVTGSRGGNAALASLLTALANYGLITDSTTA